MATDWSSYRPVPANYTPNNADLFLIQRLGSNIPETITYGKLSSIVGGGGSSITNPVLPATSGNVSIAFDGNKDYQIATQTGDIVIVPTGTTASTVKITINGDGESTFELPAYMRNRNAGSFDPDMQNSITIYRDANGIYEYSIFNDDVVAPVIQSASTNADGDEITLTYNKNLIGTPNYTPSGGKTVGSQVITASTTVVITVTVPYENTDVITISGGGVTDESGNAVASLTNYAVTNNVSTEFNVYSYNAQNLNQRLVSIANPANIAISNSGTPVAKSFSLWFKWTPDAQNAGVTHLFGAYSTANNTVYYWIYIDASGYLVFTRPGSIGGTQIGIYTNGPINAYANAWHHLTVTYDGSGTSAGFKFYMDGTLMSTSTNDGAGGYTEVDFNSNSRIVTGGSSITTPLVSTNIILDEFYVSNITLNQTQVTELYNGGEVIDVDDLSFAANIPTRWRFENNGLDSGTTGYNLTSVSTPNYLTDIP